MRTIHFPLFLFCLIASSLFSQSNINQSLSVNSTGAAADASALLDVNATDKGMLVPRMTTAQRTAIASPATGLLVFDTTTGGFWFYNGTAWMDLSSPKVLSDADGDTKIHVEQTPDEDIIRFDLAGSQRLVFRQNAFGSPRLETPNPHYNTFIGVNAGLYTTAGNFNTAIGANTLTINTIGASNTACGVNVLFNNTTGNYNTAHGNDALIYNTSGINNTAVGFGALAFNSTGSNNTALGADADVNSSGLANATAVGARALVGASNSLVLGSISGINNATASVNVGIGTSFPEVRMHIVGGSDVALSGGGFLQLGNNNTINIAIDDNEIMARNNGGIANLIFNNNGGNVGIGRTPISNQLEVNGSASKSSSGDWLANSDARLKKNIQPLNSQLMLQSLLALQGVTYEWNDDQTGSKRPEGIQYGFTAQNIQTVFPTLVEEDKIGYLQTAYGTYDAMTVEAIRALNDKIEVQQAEIERLKKIEAQLDNITAALQGMGVELK